MQFWSLLAQPEATFLALPAICDSDVTAVAVAAHEAGVLGLLVGTTPESVTAEADLKKDGD